MRKKPGGIWIVGRTLIQQSATLFQKQRELVGCFGGTRRGSEIEELALRVYYILQMLHGQLTNKMEETIPHHRGG